MTIKNRSYNATVFVSHMPWYEWFIQLADFFDDGLIEYASLALEKAKSGEVHIQAFVVWHESLFEKKLKPTDKLPGHWTKARSLTGSRDYTAGAGIHYGKEDAFFRVEFGKWVDPGWNQTLRMRLIYEFAKRIREDKWSIAQLKMLNPEGVLLLGENNLKSLWASPFTEMPRSIREPYCYIGRTSLANRLAEMVEILGDVLKQSPASEEE